SSDLSCGGQRGLGTRSTRTRGGRTYVSPNPARRARNRANRALDPAPGLFRLLGGSPRRLVAPLRAVLAVRSAVRFAGGVSSPLGGWPILRKMPAPRHEASAPAGAPIGRALCRRAARSNRLCRITEAGRPGASRGRT